MNLSSLVPHIAVSVDPVSHAQRSAQLSGFNRPVRFAFCRTHNTSPRLGDLIQRNTLKFWPKVTHPPVGLSVARIRWQIAAEWSDATVTMGSAWEIKCHRSCQWYDQWLSTTALSLKLGVPNAPIVMSIFEWPYLHNGWSDPLHVLVLWVFRVGGSNGAIFPDRSYSRWRPAAILENYSRIARFLATVSRHFIGRHLSHDSYLNAWVSPGYLSLRLTVAPVNCRPMNCRRLTVVRLSVVRWSFTNSLRQHGFLVI